MEFSSVSSAQLDRAAAVLRAGGVVAFPTETVYGLGANALDPVAVARVFEIKGRPRFDPLIVHVASLGEALELVTDFPFRARLLAEKFWPGPLTLVLPKSRVVPEIVTAGLPTVALRVPAHPVARELIRRTALPIAAPSANPFGQVSPTTAEHVARHLGQRIDELIDAGPCAIGVESTVVLLPSEGTAVLLRPGGTPVEEIEAVVGPLTLRDIEASQPLAPGQLPRHYAPRTPLELCDVVAPPPAGHRVGMLAFCEAPSHPGFAAVEILSPAGDLREAAARLFAALHRLDALGLDRIVAERVPAVGLGRAINDRLQRAAYAEKAPKPSARS